MDRHDAMDKLEDWWEKLCLVAMIGLVIMVAVAATYGVLAGD